VVVATVITAGAEGFARASDFGTAGALQHPLGADALIAAQQALGTGFGAQHAGRLAARAGSSPSEAMTTANARRSFISNSAREDTGMRGRRQAPWENRAMPDRWTLMPPYFLVFAFLSGVVGYRMGWRFRSRVALPLVQGTLGWVAFLVAWSFVGAYWAALAAGTWALGTSLASIFVFFGNPAETDQRVLRAAEYRASMLDWLATGRGPESRPAATIAQHAREVIWYTAAAIFTGNLASLVMGAALLNYMNAYVATLLRAATRTARVALLAWNVWSLVRVAAYLAIGAASAGPLLRVMGLPVVSPPLRVLATTGAIGALADVVLKLALSRRCGRALAAAVDLEAARANRPSVAAQSLHLD